jgi:hypothetical protein
MEAQPGALYALTGDIESHFGAINTLIRAVEVHSGSLDAHAGAVEDHPGALDALVGEMKAPHDTIKALTGLWKLTQSHGGLALISKGRLGAVKAFMGAPEAHPWDMKAHYEAKWFTLESHFCSQKYKSRNMEGHALQLESHHGTSLRSNGGYYLSKPCKIFLELWTHPGAIVAQSTLSWALSDSWKQVLQP